MDDACEKQFDKMAKGFDLMLARYIEDVDAGRVNDTPSQRVHDLATVFETWACTVTGHYTCAWWVAIAMERLMALQKSGLPT